MVVLRKVENYKYTTEAKQVGSLYHVTTLDGVANYIAPTDTLSGSGRYKNYLLVGDTNVVSFTRDKSFVVSTHTTRQSNVLLDFEVDGDKLSENHKIIPYNDLAYNGVTGKLHDFPTNPKLLEHEEVLIGKIHPFSKYVKSVRLCMSIHNLTEIVDINDDLQKCKNYLSKFNITYDSKLKSKLSSSLWIVKFSSFDAFVSSVEEIASILNSDSINEEKIKDAFKYFSKELLEENSKSMLFLANVDPHVFEILDIAISQKGGNSISSKKSNLTFSQVEKFLNKNDFRDIYIRDRLDKSNANSYMKYSLKDKEELLWKYSDFDSEQKYTIANMAKSWFKDHPEDVDCGPYGKLSDRDFEKEINIYKIFNYLYRNYDKRKVDSLLFDLIYMDGKNIASQEFNFIEDPDVYTLGVSKLKGNDLFEYLTTWTDLFSEKELLLKLKDL